MRKIVLFMVLSVSFGVIGSNLWADSAPEVQNVRVSQDGGNSKIVTVIYDLVDIDNDLCTVWLLVSSDGGVNWNIWPKTVWGDVHADQTPGTDKVLNWDAGADVPGLAGDSFKVRVCADDGNGMANMILVPQCQKYPQLGDYWVGKYEVTNREYCEFLNAGDDVDSYWDGQMEIIRTGAADNYIYSVQAGRENYPITFVSFDDATSYCQWLSQRESRQYRLAQGDEWYKAAAYDPIEDKTYAYGIHSDSISADSANYGNNLGAPTLVGTYNGTNGKQNAKSYYGGYDMCGNVSEWTNEMNGSYHISRGGAFDRSSSYCTTAYMWASTTGGRSDNTGFRIVLDLD